AGAGSNEGDQVGCVHGPPPLLSGLDAAEQNAEIHELRRQITRLTLAAAVLTHDRPAPPAADTSNVVPLRGPS
ncbi:hypothetical protein, partial [Streptomyces sp. Ncost-T10-10d]|uniref:hypothetical protein n=1 Tax=Streptomyces sp. Ncost-T10-10d TaxID=1839774 RepID=UPI00081DB87E